MLSLLIIIYIAFISLGLPDSMLGTAWPMIYPDLAIPISYSGILAMIICGGTVISSLMFARLSRRFSTIQITAVSVAMTAAALILFSAAPSFFFLIPISLLLGLGAGSVDAALNNYVALHYKARAMNFLHAFWGLGTLIGPFVMSYLFANGFSWRNGYRILGGMQAAVCLILILSVPLWRKAGKSTITTTGDEPSLSGNGSSSALSALRKPGAIMALLAFFAYCSAEQTTMLWSASFLVEARGLTESAAAATAGLFFIGITSGRIISGLVSGSIAAKTMLRSGQAVITTGVILMLALPGNLAGIALFLIGMGCGPIYPTMLHQTPEYFGAEDSARIMGLQMATAYVGSSFMPALFGIIGRNISLSLFPLYVLMFVIINTAAVEVKRIRRFGRK